MYFHIECKFMFLFETSSVISLYRVYSKEINIVENMLKHIRKPLPIAKHTARNKDRTVQLNLKIADFCDFWAKMLKTAKKH